MTDWRLPENRREAFQRFYSFHLKYRSHPGCVYYLLPAIADAYDLDEDGLAWLVWLNGNTQNVVTSLLLLEAAPRPQDWAQAVAFWDDNFKALEWDTDRRHQKSKFGVATEQWWEQTGGAAAQQWLTSAEGGGDTTWGYSLSQPYMGRLSAWSMLEYARILFGPVIPDMPTFLMQDKSGSQSHRNGAAFVAGYDSVYWEADAPFLLGIVPEIEEFAEDLLREAQGRNLVEDCDCPPPYADCMHDPLPHPDVSRLTLESALCTYKSFSKENRRYPGVYNDMMYNRIRKAEARFPGEDFSLLWDTRRAYLPRYLRLEDNPNDPGLVPEKQNHYRSTGQIPVLGHEWPDMWSDFDQSVQEGRFGVREDKSWVL